MVDITIVWDPVNAQGDWAVAANGDLQTGNDLATSILISLFTDRVLPNDQLPPDGTKDRRGWWADTYEDMPIGSRLWTLARIAIFNRTQLLATARDMCNEALAWLIVDGVAQAVNVQTSFPAPTLLGIQIQVIEPNGNIQPFSFSWATAGITTVPPVAANQEPLITEMKSKLKSLAEKIIADFEAASDDAKAHFEGSKTEAEQHV